MTLPERNIEPAVLMKLKSIDDLVRLVHFWMLRKQSASILHFKDGDRHILGTFTALPGYYELEGLPLFLYVEVKDPPAGPFIRYRTDPSEEWSYTDATYDRKWLYVPVISLAKLPVFLKL